MTYKYLNIYLYITWVYVFFHCHKKVKTLMVLQMDLFFFVQNRFFFSCVPRDLEVECEISSPQNAVNPCKQSFVVFERLVTQILLKWMSVCVCVRVYLHKHTHTLSFQWGNFLRLEASLILRNFLCGQTALPARRFFSPPLWKGNCSHMPTAESERSPALPVPNRLHMHTAARKRQSVQLSVSVSVAFMLLIIVSHTAAYTITVFVIKFAYICF